MSKIYVDEIHPKTAGGNVGPVINCLAQVSGTVIPSDQSVIVWNQVEINRGSVYNSSTGEFTAPADGLYEVGFSLLQNGGGTLDDLNVAIYKNGSAPTYSSKAYSQIDSSYQQISQHRYIELEANDVITIVKLDGDFHSAGDHNSAYFRYIGA